MKNIGKELIITTRAVVNFDFTESELDFVLAQPQEKQNSLFQDLITKKNPIREDIDYNLRNFKEAAAKAVLEYREKQLKQLPAPMP